MRKISNKSAKTALKRYEKKYADTSPLYGDFDKRIRLRRIVLGYETLIKCIDRLSWVIDTEFVEGDDFKKERYDDWKDRISKVEDHIAWCKAH